MRGESLSVWAVASLLLMRPLHAVAAEGAGAVTAGASGVLYSLADGPSPEQLPSGWRMGLDQAAARQTNPLRQPEGSPWRQGDRVLTSAGDAALSLAWGRQALSGWGRLERTQYGHIDVLDHNAHAAQVSWDARWPGDLGSRVWRRSQSDLAEALPRLDLPTGQRVEQRIEQTGALLEWGLQRRWSAQASWQHDDVRDAVPGSWTARVEQDTLSAGVQWRGAGPLMMGLSRREVQGRQETSGASTGAVNAQGPIDYSQQLWDLQGRWAISPGRWVGLRWSSGRGDGAGGSAGDPSASQPGAPDSRRHLHSLRWDLRWRLQSSLSLGARLWRDEGLQAQVLQAIGQDARLWATSASAFRDARVDLNWDVSSHLRATAAVQSMLRQDLRGLSLTVVDGVQGQQPLQTLRDRTWRGQFTLSWRPRPAWAVACTLQTERRRAWLDQATGTAPVPGHEGQGLGCLVRGEIGARGFNAERS